MPTPTKNITYLTDALPRARPVMPPVAMLSRGCTALGLFVSPSLWRPLSYSAPQARGRTVLIPRPLYLRAMTALKTTLFWRANPSAILKGQQYP